MLSKIHIWFFFFDIKTVLMRTHYILLSNVVLVLIFIQEFFDFLFFFSLYTVLRSLVWIKIQSSVQSFFFFWLFVWSQVYLFTSFIIEYFYYRVNVINISFFWFHSIVFLMRNNWIWFVTEFVMLVIFDQSLLLLNYVNFLYGWWSIGFRLSNMTLNKIGPK